MYLSGGMNTGKTNTNICDIVTDNPQITYGSPRTPEFCNPDSPWSAQTQVKFAAVYSLPWDVQTSATMQAYPGQTQSASFSYSNAQILPSLGRNLSSCGTAAVCNGTSVINVVPGNQIFEDRYAQFDVRLAKTVRVSRTSLQGILDVYNAFNARPVLGVITRYSGTTGGSWLSPTSTLVGRLIKVSAQINF